MMIPRVGFRYRPSVEHLVEALKYKAKGGEMSVYPKIRLGDIVEIEDLYGENKEPWKVFSGSNEITELHNVDDWQQKSRVKYIVTKLRKSGRKNYCRGAGDGSWDGQGTKAVECEGQEILEMATLTFEFRGDPSDAVGKPHYYMHEYHLSRHSLDQIGLESTDYVLCRVIKDLSKRCHVKKGKKRGSSSAITIDDHSKKKAKKSHDVQGCLNEESSMILEEFPGIMLERCENVPGCSSDHEQVLTMDDFPDALFESCEKEAPDCAGFCDPGCVIDDPDSDYRENVASCSAQVLTLDDFPDALFESCEKEAPNRAGICNPGCVIDSDCCENVVGCSSDLEQVLTLDDISALLFGNGKNLDIDHEAEEEMTVDEHSDMLFGNEKNLDIDHEAEEEMTVDKYSDLLFGNQEDLKQCFSSEFISQ